MTGIQALQHVDRLLSSHLSHNDPVRPHSKGRPDQVPDRHFSLPLRIGTSGFQADQIAVASDLQLGIIFDRDDSLVFGNEIRQRIQESGLPASGSPGNENVIACLNHLLQKICSLGCDGAPRDQVFHSDRSVGKPPDRDHRTFDGNRIHDDIHSLTLLQARVHDRNGFICDTVRNGDDRLHDILQFLP